MIAAEKPDNWQLRQLRGGGGEGHFGLERIYDQLATLVDKHKGEVVINRRVQDPIIIARNPKMSSSEILKEKSDFCPRRKGSRKK